MTNLKYFSSLLILMCLSLFSQAQSHLDSFNLKKATLGINLELGANTDRLFKNFQGNYLSVGVNYEKQILNNVSLITGGGLRYKEYNRSLTQVINTSNADTATILNIFDVNTKSLGIITPFHFKFHYNKQPSLYLLIGISPEFTLYSKHQEDYLRTDYRDDRSKLIGTVFDENDKSITPSNEWLNITLDYGIGFNFSSMAIELLVKDGVLNFKGNSVGLRYIKYFR